MIRAYICFIESPAYGCALVLAKSRNRAKQKALHFFTGWGNSDCKYIDISARLANAQYDNISDGVERIYETNEDLPKWVSPFYTEVDE